MTQSLAIPRVIPNDWKRLDLIINKIKFKLGSASSPTFTGVTITGLTASSLIGTNASKALESVTVGTGLAYARPTLSLSHLGIEALTDPGADRILFWDDSETASKWLVPNTLISITGTNLNVDNDLHNYDWTSVDATDLKVGSVTQAYHANLDSLSGLTYAAAAFVKMTGANTFVLRTLQETSDDLESTIDHDNLLNFAANEHYLQSAIIEVGTIATGVWEGTSIAVAYTDAKCIAVWPDTYTADQNLLQASSPTFAGLTLTGNIILPDDGTIGVTDGTPSLLFDNTDGRAEFTGVVTVSDYMSIADGAAQSNIILHLSKHWEITAAGDNTFRKGASFWIYGGKTGAADYTSYLTAIGANVNLQDPNTQDWTSQFGLRGISIDIRTEGSTTGTLTGAVGLYLDASFQNSMTVTNYYGIYHDGVFVDNNKLVNAYGIYLEDFDDATTLNYAIYTNAGLVRFGDNVSIPDAGYIGSASDTDAIQIEADGDVVLTQSLGVGKTPSLALYDSESTQLFGIMYKNTNSNSYAQFGFRNDANEQMYFGISGSNIGGAYADLAYMNAPTGHSFAILIQGGRKLIVASDGNIVLKKTSGIGIKVDVATPTFGWRDLKGKITNSKGATKPSEITYREGITQFQFGAGDDAGLEYHIPHDYVPGTNIHLHVHWSHISGAVTGGNVVFTYEITYCKGHNQAAFPATVTGTIIGTASATQYKHIISEGQISISTGSGTQIDTDDLEPDGLILCRIEMTTNNMTGATPSPFIHEVDVHYQSTNLGTKQKAPPFYT